jgi:hypothetical protein
LLADPGGVNAQQNLFHYPEKCFFDFPFRLPAKLEARRKIKKPLQQS